MIFYSSLNEYIMYFIYLLHMLYYFSDARVHLEIQTYAGSVEDKKRKMAENAVKIFKFWNTPFERELLMRHVCVYHNI